MDAIIAGISVGIVTSLISPFILSWLQNKYIWKREKQFEIKKMILEDAIKALSRLEADALDANLQSNKPEYEGRSRLVEFRPGTIEQLESARGMVRAFFPKNASDAFDAATRAEVSIETVPNIDFEKKKSQAIKILSDEL